MFEKVNSKVVKVHAGQAGGVVARTGSMLFYQGDISFSPHQVPGANQMGGMGGLMGMAGRMMAGEHERTMLAQGNGEVHYGFAGLEVHVVHMQPGATLRVEASRLLANTAGLQSSIVSVASSGGQGGRGGGLMGALRGAASGVLTGQGMFTTQLSGQGAAVLLGHGGFIELQVGGPNPVVVDPQAFVASYGNVQTELKTAMSWRDAVGRGSGEAMQLHCVGQGVVFVQASEEKL
ncbi:AIM24 family protein [Nocardia otitidiscaviarum]|uniref:AIM24 family protein n=1 Tax=Nocardia TaxID=1817 RepID=UPI0004A77307|nr:MULTISPECIES: AIM24 family protein [Nocardia]MBF6137277.1 AIM24 family protein [Nocardia otitidiscaviarum]MBF6178594.1 AIM24 family protein [Nocardia otitidiscaviarum]MBF6237783.1 AIM24 family protein [Nocardia otitidiscaviarum]MBF6488173.1 AIM24 family protein [Nocardia otitidiscaviarum]